MTEAEAEAPYLPRGKMIRAREVKTKWNPTHAFF